MADSIRSKIVDKISRMPENEVFTASDFSDIAGNKTVSKTLDRICDSAKHNVHKVFRGIFWKSGEKVITLRQQPEPVKVAFALARANKWTIAPSGKTAAYIMGVTAEKPSEWTFVTDGTYREYKLPGCRISFKHTAGKLLFGLSEKTALLVHTIKEYGDACIPESVKDWAKKLTKVEKDIIIKETQQITDWISKTIKVIMK